MPRPSPSPMASKGIRMIWYTASCRDMPTNVCMAAPRAANTSTVNMPGMKALKACGMAISGVPPGKCRCSRLMEKKYRNSRVANTPTRIATNSPATPSQRRLSASPSCWSRQKNAVKATSPAMTGLARRTGLSWLNWSVRWWPMEKTMMRDITEKVASFRICPNIFHSGPNCRNMNSL